MGRTGDSDPIETKEWLEALDGVIELEGVDRAHFLMGRVLDQARTRGAAMPYSATTPYLNTIPAFDREAPHPGDRVIEHRIRSYIRWNALAIAAGRTRKARNSAATSPASSPRPCPLRHGLHAFLARADQRATDQRAQPEHAGAEALRVVGVEGERGSGDVDDIHAAKLSPAAPGPTGPGAASRQTAQGGVNGSPPGSTA